MLWNVFKFVILSSFGTLLYNSSNSSSCDNGSNDNNGNNDLVHDDDDGSGITKIDGIVIV